MINIIHKRARWSAKGESDAQEEKRKVGGKEIVGLLFRCRQKVSGVVYVCCCSGISVIISQWANSTNALINYLSAWLGSRVVSVLDSGAVGRARVQIAAATLSGNSLRQTVHTHCAFVHQAAKLVAALLRVARVTAGLAESNGSLLLGL